MGVEGPTLPALLGMTRRDLWAYSEYCTRMAYGTMDSCILGEISQAMEGLTLQSQKIDLVRWREMDPGMEADVEILQDESYV